MDLESKLTELKYDYVRLQNDLDKKNRLIKMLIHY